MPPSPEPIEPSPSTAAADAWWRSLPVALRSSAAAERLRADYFASHASADLADRSPEDLSAAVASHVAAGMRRPPGEAMVRAVDGPISGAGEQSSTVEVVAEDMPFLVESVTAALTRMGRGIHTVVHPRFAARRDESGALLDLHRADDATPRDAIEAWIRLEVDPESDQAARDVLVAELVSVLADVRAAVRDWRWRLPTSSAAAPPRGSATRSCTVPHGSCPGSPTTASPSSATRSTTRHRLTGTSSSRPAREPAWVSSPGNGRSGTW
jgi:glutamate dehydrogenase